MAQANTPDDHTTPVVMPSGALFQVYPQEEGYFTDRVQRYLKDNHFTNVSDFQDVDRMLIFELLVQRYGTWVMQQKDYWGDPVDEPAMTKQIKELSTELRQLKLSLGIDKVSRDKQRGEDSVSAYLERLRQRAKEFGVHRNDQAAKAMELMNKFISLITLMDNCDEIEQREQRCRLEDTMAWVREGMIPEYQAIDEKFRGEKQRYWIRDQ